MISKEEMYDFASQIAGITESDLEVYKCGGKAHKTKKHEKGTKINNISFKAGGGVVDGTDAPVYVPRFNQPPQNKRYSTLNGERIPVSQRAADGYKEDAYTTYINGNRVVVQKVAKKSPLSNVIGEWVVQYYNAKGEPVGSRRYLPGQKGYDEFDAGAYQEYLKALDYDFKESRRGNRR